MMLAKGSTKAIGRVASSSITYRLGWVVVPTVPWLAASLLSTVELASNCRISAEVKLGLEQLCCDFSREYPNEKHGRKLTIVDCLWIAMVLI